MSDQAKRRLLLIGWDAADWQHINPLLEEGILPNLDALISRGVMGNLATLQPMLSPMLWNSIATGKLADKHGIHGFIEPDPVNGGARPFTSTSRKVKALWNIFSQTGLRSNVVGWWASHPAEPILGTVVTNAFGGVKFLPDVGWTIPPGTVHPPEKAADLAHFKVFPSELTAAHILPFIPNAEKIDQHTDQHLRTFAKILSDAASIHAVATALMELESWDFTAVYYDAIDHFSHAFMVYHPPKLAWVPDEEFEQYRDVIRSAYRFHDMMLGRLVELAGPDTTILLCSDHGFESGPQRPQFIPREPAGPAIWHRQYGILVLAGPGIRKDERVYGANLLDIAPTVLTLFNLPVGSDMDGRVLSEVFEAAPKILSIPSWENVPGEAGMHVSGQLIDRDQAQELMRQFAALGYIENPETDQEKQAESASIESQFNLAKAYLGKSQPAEAVNLLQQCLAARPWEDRFISLLASAYMQAGYLRQAERLLAMAYDVEKTPHAAIKILWGKIKLRQGDLKVGLQNLNSALALSPGNARLHVDIGNVYLTQRRYLEARAAYEHAIELDPDYALAHQGLSEVHRRLGNNQATVDSALKAVGMLHRLPQAHLNLGIALARAGENERALVALETALQFNPELVHAHRLLALLHRHLGHADRARHHRAAVGSLQRSKTTPAGIVRGDFSRLGQEFPLPPIPSAKERVEILMRERPDPKPPDIKQSGKTFVLVSGLPRSGTSLMMQALRAGGIEALTDNKRIADRDNPLGYLEWEPIKQIARQPELLDDEGIEKMAIKCISMLLPQLPAKHSYKVVFMIRPIEEIVRSQQAMTARLETKGADLDDATLMRGLQSHRDETLHLLATAPQFESIQIDYPSFVNDPSTVVSRLVDFLGADRLPNAAAMSAVVDPSLYRRKAEET